MCEVGFSFLSERCHTFTEDQNEAIVNCRLAYLLSDPSWRTAHGKAFVQP
jgi:hypothetical protein